MAAAKPPVKPRLYNITQVGGGEQVIAAPPTSRVTMFGGGGTGNAVVRVYLGNRLIGYFPNVVEFYEVGQVLRTAHTLPTTTTKVKFTSQDNTPFLDVDKDQPLYTQQLWEAITAPSPLFKYLKGQTK